MIFDIFVKLSLDKNFVEEKESIMGMDFTLVSLYSTEITRSRSNYICYKVWEEIIHPFPNFNGTAIEEWMRNLFPYFTGHMITCPCQD